MTINLNRLTRIGFALAGKWLLAKGGLELALHDASARKSPILYAFAVDGALVYVGKTTLTLRERMQRYKTPPRSRESGGSTNIKNNRNIAAALVDGHVVEIYVLHVQRQERHGEFLVNLAAGLEDNLIEELNPPWNGRPKPAAGMDMKQALTSPTPHGPNERILKECPQAVAMPILKGNLMRQVTIKHSQQTKTDVKLSKDDFQIALRKVLSDATSAGETSIDVR